MKRSYLILLGLFLLFTLGFFFFEDRILFFCYGFPQKLISADTRDSMKAYASIDNGRFINFVLTLFISILFSIRSFKGFRNSTGTKRIVFGLLAGIGIAITLILCWVLVIGIIMANIGGGIIG